MKLRDPWKDRKTARRQQSIYERLWRNFQLQPNTVDGRHDTEEWSSTGEFFVACVISLNNGDVTEALAPLTSDLMTIGGARVHPPHFRHIMLQELGVLQAQSESRYEITPERLEEFISAAEVEFAHAPSFAISLGGVNAFQDSIILEVRDDGQTASLHRRLNELAAIPVRSPYAYLPHTTMAHFTRQIPNSDVIPVLQPWRTPDICGCDVQQVDVVTFDVTGEYPEPYVHASFVLGTSQSDAE